MRKPALVILLLGAICLVTDGFAQGPGGSEEAGTSVSVEIVKKEKFDTYTRVSTKATVKMDQNDTFESVKVYFTDPKGKEIAGIITKFETPSPGKTTVIEYYVDATTEGNNWSAFCKLDYKKGGTMPLVKLGEKTFGVP